MSIIFQLFSAEDLQKLTRDELLLLRDKIVEALKPPDQPELEELPPFELNLTPKTIPDNPTPPQWVHDALLKRFYEVSHQLKTPPRNTSQERFDYDGLIQKRKSEDTQSQEELILNWAISCELNHIEFYESLLKAQKVAYDFFEQTIRARIPKTSETPETKEAERPRARSKEPDSAYSPFNPRHPLYKQFSDLSKPVPNPPEPPNYSGT
jgi:hypothetical protein